MVEKKGKVTKKNKATIVKPKKEKKTIVAQNIETLFPASKIVNILNVPNFDYFIMAKKYGFDDNSLFTIAQFKKMYKETIKEGR